MDYQDFSIIIMLLVFITYVSFIWRNYGVLPSISESYYVLPKSEKLLFTLFCWSFAIPAMILGSSLAGTPLMFLAGIGICFVGAAAQFKQELIKEVHTIGAFCGILFSQLSIAFDFKMYYVNVIFVVLGLLILLTKIKNRIWWLELVAFSSICYVLGKQLL